MDIHEDRMEHLRCMKAAEMASVLFHFGCNAKKEITAIIEQKAQRGVYPTADEALDLVFDQFNKLMELHGLDVNEIID